MKRKPKEQTQMDFLRTFLRIRKAWFILLAWCIACLTFDVYSGIWWAAIFQIIMIPVILWGIHKNHEYSQRTIDYVIKALNRPD